MRMIKRVNKALKNKGGFTLIELIVVIAVLGILAAVAIPRFGNVTKDANDNATAQELRILNEALERYVAVTGDKELNELGVNLSGNNVTDAVEVIKKLIEKEYLRSNAADDGKLPNGNYVKLEQDSQNYYIFADSNSKTKAQE